MKLPLLLSLAHLDFTDDDDGYVFAKLLLLSSLAPLPVDNGDCVFPEL